MLADTGLFATAIAFLLAVYATATSLLGGLRERPTWVKSARNAALLVFPLLSVAVFVLVYLLYTLDFSIAYVADVSARQCHLS
jgi:cytochrome c biogenesis factor